MRYFSTRDCGKFYNFEHVFMSGLSEDGGLYIPERIPEINLGDLSKMSFSRLAFNIFRCYIDEKEIDDNDLYDIIAKSFWNMPIFLRNFSSFSILELFHGPTLSFKDVALQVVGNLFEYFCKKRDRKITILGATSGDTGSAAIYGVKGKKNINCFILYPKNKVSEFQRRQMTTVLDSNIYNIEVGGNFDDCQKIVKDLFLDEEFKHTYNLASVNSINWARIVAQMVYYFYAYFEITDDNLNMKINFSVPTGNFGNILAGFYAKKMGLPINKLLIATNNNDILYRIMDTGIYEKQEFQETLSPAMDITISSNFERLLWYLVYEKDNNMESTSERVKEYMKLLETSGKFNLEDRYLKIMKDYFISEKTLDIEIMRTIRVIYKELNYLIDPHTAVGINGYLKSVDMYKNWTICIATAHASKFSETIKSLGIGDWFISNKLRSLCENKERFISLLADKDEIKGYIKEKLKEKY